MRATTSAGTIAFITDQFGAPTQTTVAVSAFLAGVMSAAKHYQENETFPSIRLLASSTLSGAGSAMLVKGIVDVMQHLSETLDPYVATAIGGAAVGAFGGYAVLQTALQEPFVLMASHYHSLLLNPHGVENVIRLQLQA